MRRIICILFIMFFVSCVDNPETTGILIGNRKYGEWKTYYPNGRLLTVKHYINDTLHGKSITYSENGNPYTSTTYRMGVQVDSFVHYFSNGNVNFQQWADSNGRSQGLFKIYYENGQLRQIGYHRDGHLHDTNKIFHQNGNIKAVECYLSGKREGTWTFYDQLGNIVKTETYKNDSKISN